MKKLFYPLLGLLVTSSILQAQTIAQWTFETSVPTTAGPYSPEIGSGSASGYHALSAAVYSNPVGNGSLESYSANYWSVGDFWQFQVSTPGYFGVRLSWDQTSSSTGPTAFQLDYSLNSGSSWTPFTSYTVSTISWSSLTYNPISTFSYDLGGAVDNQSTVWFRLINNSTVATGGTDRIDNFTVAVPEPTSLSLMGGFGLLAWTLIRRRK